MITARRAIGTSVACWLKGTVGRLAAGARFARLRAALKAAVAGSEENALIVRHLAGAADGAG